MNVTGLPVGPYVAELRADCKATGEVRAAHRLLLIVGAEGVGSSRALIGKSDEVADGSTLVAVLRPRDAHEVLPCGTFTDGFP